MTKSTRPSRIGRRGLLAAAGGLLAAPANVQAQGQNGVALVIGNSKYQWEASLPNVKRDAPDVARAFQALGLRTELLQDQGDEAMRAAIARFGEAARGARFAAFYFAGHGVTWEKQTYIAPADADLSKAGAVKNLVSVPSINAAMKGAANRLLVFDSCRNNPADGWKQRAAKIAAMVDAADKVEIDLNDRNTLTLFSTASGAIALDGPPGDNSPFAASFLRQLGAPSVDLKVLPAKLRRDLLLATECRQVLWDHNNYAESFVLNGPARSAVNVSPARYDPSRVVELDGAYAYAKRNGLVIPAGLVAYRASNPTADAQMVGAYGFPNPARVAPNRPEAVMMPALFIVMSTPEGLAEAFFAGKDWGSGNGTRWRYVNGATRTDKKVSFLAIDEESRLEFVWREQNTGTVSHVPVSTRTFVPTNQRFTRLDG